MGCGKEDLSFEFSVVHGGRPLIEGGSVLGGITIIMRRYWTRSSATFSRSSLTARSWQYTCLSRF